MSEAEYWESLRFRINCLPTSRSAGGVALPGWCDWLEPRRYILDGPSPRITGRVGFVNGRDAWRWRFTLSLGRPVGPAPEIAWATLLPPEGSVAWLSSDESGEAIWIDPRAGARIVAEPGTAPDRGGR